MEDIDSKLNPEMKEMEQKVSDPLKETQTILKVNIL